MAFYLLKLLLHHLFLFQNYVIFQNRVLLIHCYRIHKAVFPPTAVIILYTRQKQEPRLSPHQVSETAAFRPTVVVVHQVTAEKLWKKNLFYKLTRKNWAKWKHPGSSTERCPASSALCLGFESSEQSEHISGNDVDGSNKKLKNSSKTIPATEQSVVFKIL